MISPTEPNKFHSLGKTSSFPETQGADFFWMSPLGKIGVQRKEIGDLIMSVRDGRLGKELSQMSQLDIGVLLIEGSMRWTESGSLLTNVSWTRQQHRGLIFSVFSRGYWVLSTTGSQETIECLLQLNAWSRKEKHGNMPATRPKASGTWGSATSKDWAIHMLQSFPGCGPGVAETIYEEYGLPLAWTISEDDIQQLKGIGPKRTRLLWDALHGP